jgi:hypothetical protein
MQIGKYVSTMAQRAIKLCLEEFGASESKEETSFAKII